MRSGRRPAAGNRAISKVDAVGDFLEVFIHAILHARKVYPEVLFEDKHAYGVPVKASRHPELNRYIFDAVAAIKAELNKEDVPGDVLVDIIDGDGRSREAFALEISTLRGSYERIYDVDLRAALIRLSTLEPPPAPHNDTSFRVCYRPKDGGAPSLDENSWIRRLDTGGPTGAPTDDGPQHPRLVALAAVDGSELKLQVFALLDPCHASEDVTHGDVRR